MSLAPLSMSEFTGHPKPLANEIEAAQIDRAILRGTDKVLERALRMVNALRLAGDEAGAKALHDLAQLLGAVARNDRKPTEVTEL